MEYGIICPISELETIAVKSHYHLVLAHMVDSSEIYRNFYRKMAERGDTITLDNSDYEFEKLGKPNYSVKELIMFGNFVKATEIMAPERYQDSNQTVELFMKFRESVPSEFRVFCTIHGETFGDLLSCFLRIIDKVDTVGLSCRLLYDWKILNFSLEEHTSLYKGINRLLIVNAIIQECLFRKISLKRVKFHLLGMNHPLELLFYKGLNLSLKPYFDLRSLDSSCCYTAGINNVDFEEIQVKGYEKPADLLDFYYPLLNSTELRKILILKNINFIHQLIKEI